MWTNENRARYDRDHLRYPSDVTDAEWGLVAPLNPRARRGGRRREVAERDVVNGLMYVLSTGCQWRYIPKVFRRRARFTVISAIGAMTGCWIASITRSTSNAARNSIWKPVPPPASSTAKASRARKKGALHRSARLRRRQTDQGKEAPHPRRHAGVARAGARHAGERPGSRGRRRVVVDVVRNVPVPQETVRRQRLSGAVFHTALASILPNLETEIVKRSDAAKGFVALPKRWIVERSIAWLNGCRRLAKDWGNRNLSALIFLRLASIRLMLRKL